MSLQTVGAIVCLFLAQVAADTGVHFVMERHPDSYFCGHLQCVADFTKSDQDVSTCVEMTIYDITQVNPELKLASVSAFHPDDLYVDTTNSSAMSCTGTISRLQANLTLKLRHDIDCLYGVYKCQLDLVTESGHLEVHTEIVIPKYNHNYSRVAEVISHIDELFNIHTTLVSNQTTVINKLDSHLVDITSQLMNQTAEIDRLGNHADHEIIKLTNQTAEINKLGSRLDNQTTQLTDQTVEINKLGSRLDNQTTQLTDQTVEINKLGSHLDNQTTQLTDQTVEINKLGSRLDNQTTQLTDQTVEINKLGSRLDYQTTQLTDQTTEINKLGSRLDNQTTQLTDQTTEINKLGSRLDNQTTQLTDQTAEINKLGSRLDNQTTQLTDQTAEINKLGNRLDDLTVQLINQTAQLDNMSQRLDLETTKQKQQHDVVKKRLMALALKLDAIQQLSMYIADMFPDQTKDNCIKGQSHRNGTKRITLWGNTTALCDTTTDGGGWIIIQRRTDGDVGFFRDWNEYKTGFKDLYTGFWLGNDAIHVLAEQGYNELRIDMIYKGKRAYARYSNFSVASEALNYQLTVGAYEGTAGDSLTYHNNMYFSTFDRDNDKIIDNCADLFYGGWWFNDCIYSNWIGRLGLESGMLWYTLAGLNPLSFSEMKVRRG